MFIRMLAAQFPLAFAAAGVGEAASARRLLRGGEGQGGAGGESLAPMAEREIRQSISWRRSSSIRPNDEFCALGWG